MATDGWFPGAIRDPGKNVNYRSGRTSNQMDVAHFTVGTDSRALIRNNGLAAFLFPKQGPPFQFAQADSVTAHACEFNRKGCGYEVERLNWDEPFTADQTRWVGEVLRWRNAEYGVPLVHYGGPRLPTDTGFRGIANHGSLVHHACDQHTDGWTDAEFQAAVGSVTTPASVKKDRHMKFIQNTDQDLGIWQTDGIVKSHVTAELWAFYNGPFGAAIASELGFTNLGVVKVNQAVWDSWITVPDDSAGIVKRFLAKLFPAKAARAGA